MLIDIHTHIQQFEDKDLSNLIINSRNAKIEVIVAAGTTIEDSKKCVNLSNEVKEVYAAVGIHPQNIKDDKTDGYLNVFKELLKCKKTIMISEIGLDIQDDSVPLKIQKKIFSEQINLAKEVKKPIAFHVRNAEKEIIDIIISEKLFELNSVAHYFNGTYNYAKKLLDNNIFISVAKPILRDKNLEEVIKKIPLNKIVIETDSYPQYFKKNRNRWTEPKDLNLIIIKLSEIFKIDKDIIVENIYNNSKKILKL